jgi:hypothetical protein
MFKTNILYPVFGNLTNRYVMMDFEMNKASVAARALSASLVKCKEINGKFRKKQNYFRIPRKLWKRKQLEDLFTSPKLLPVRVRQILQRYGYENGDVEYDYEALLNLLSELNRVGYTFEYYLDAVPYNLTRL